MVKASTSRGIGHFMQAMGLVHLGFSRCKLAWSNKRSELANIRERLDCGVANIQSRVAYPNAKILRHFLAPSDQIPLILKLFGHETNAPKAFKSETFWTRESSCFDIVAHAWAQNSWDDPAWNIFKKICAIRYTLIKWNKKDI